MLESIPPKPRSSLRILVVDDHVDSAKALSRLLIVRGYASEYADSAEAAIQATAVAPFDLMICDISMPHCDGWELLQRIQRERPIRGIAVSGYLDEVTVRRSIDAGYLAHLGKPIKMESLVAEIEKAMATPTGGRSRET